VTAATTRSTRRRSRPSRRSTIRSPGCRATTTGRTATARRTAVSTDRAAPARARPVRVDRPHARRPDASLHAPDARLPGELAVAFGPVTYVGLNVQGSNDNFPHRGVDGEPIDRGATAQAQDAEITREDAEHTAREQANLQWLRETFAAAKATHARAVLVVWQADPNFNNEQKQTNTNEWDRYPAYVDKLRILTEAFTGQVALVHGDSHYFKVDKPINRPDGAVLANFIRVETFGARNTHWVAGQIDPTDTNLFTFEPRIVAANAQ
jgi:hypothetical protein